MSNEWAFLDIQLMQKAVAEYKIYGTVFINIYLKRKTMNTMNKQAVTAISCCKGY